MSTTRSAPPPAPRPLSRPGPVFEDPAPGRVKQATFERGIALAYVVIATEAIAHLKTLSEGLRWIADKEALDDALRTLDLLHRDILQAQEQKR